MVWYAVTLFVGFSLGFLLAALLAARGRATAWDLDEIPAASDEYAAPAKSGIAANETRGVRDGAGAARGSEESETPDSKRSERRASGSGG